jgi:ankyrin repeat protein
MTHNITALNLALRTAARKGDIHSVSVLLADGAEVNGISSDRWTALMGAAKNGHTDTVHLLLEQGADPNVRNHLGSTAIMYAVGKRYREIVYLLLRAGANSNERERQYLYSFTLLMLVVREDDAEIACLLLDYGAEINAQVTQEISGDDTDCEVGKTALMIAIERNSGDAFTIVRLLLDRGADVNVGIDTEDAPTALTKAALQPNDALFELLLERGAKVGRGSTVMRHAASHGDVPRMRRLRTMGADIEGASGPLDKTPLMEAVSCGNIEAVQFLLDEGADVNARAKNGTTALDCVEVGYTKIAALLRAAGAIR